MSLIITITDAGRAEIVNAENTGTTPVLITEIGFGDGQYVPDRTQTALQNETKRISTLSGQVVAPDTIHVTAQDASADAYNVGEFGLYTDSGTLFAVFSQQAAAGWIIEKSSVSTLLLATDIIFSNINAASLAFGDAAFLNPPATTTTQGVVELATSAETQAGTDTARAVTPKGLADTYTAANVLEKIKTVDGNGSGLDADLLDGQQGSYYSPAGAVSMFAMPTPPTGWLKANGAAISRAAYAALFAAIGTTFGNGDGSTTFNLPDLRGEFLRVWDDGRGVDIGRGFASLQGYQIQWHAHPFGNGLRWVNAGANLGSSGAEISQVGGGGYPVIDGVGGSETRPRNVALLACIKY
ncbi:MAG: tail fiber protein [Betaproteobacteria bacterium]|nr:tail fiber protein [Betaproteobacteria bacterium]